MKSPIQRYAFFFASLLSCLLITVGFEIWAWTSLRGKSLSYALSNSAGYLSVPAIAVFTYAPFLVVAWICASLARVSWSRALGLFAVCIAIFAAMYYSAYMRSEAYMLQRAWTAASLAVGLIPLETWPVLLIALVARLVLGRINVPRYMGSRPRVDVMESVDRRGWSDGNECS
jgi:hypothetical protein